MKVFIHITFSICFVLISLSHSAWGQNAVLYDVTGSGAGVSSGGGFYLHYTMGQPAPGVSNIPANELKSGYWYVLDRLHIGPTSSVVITALALSFSRGGVDLRWAIGHADGLQGFNVYRSEREGSGFERLNAELIPSDKGSAYRDEGVRPGKSYWYQLGAIDRDGESFSFVVSIRIPVAKTTLYQNYPNPFNPSTTISFYLAKPEHVVLTIYDVQGKRIRQLMDTKRDFGHVDLSWDGTNDHGDPVGSGIYFYRLKTGKKIMTKKLTLLK
jgi:hypothetical protein